ncbi:MAG: hypothetical protein ACLQBL_23810 [Polyangiaceae bacterium]
MRRTGIFLASLGAGLGFVACTRSPVAAPAAIHASPGGWRFEVAGSTDGASAPRAARSAPEELTVEATFPPGTPAGIGVEGGVERFVKDARVATDGGWRALTFAHDELAVPECASRGCRVRYRFLIGDAARAVQNTDTAAAFGDAIEAPPSTWLLHPSGAAPASYRIHVDPSAAFLSPIPAASDAENTYEARGAGLEVAPFAAFGVAWHVRRVTLGSSTITIGIAPFARARALDDDGVVQWITDAARGIATFYGRFPCASPLFLVVPDEGTTTDGKTLGNGGASTLLRLGPAVTPAIARGSWVATHEMIHMNFPSFGFPHSWLEEGIATYVEPIIRARSGVISPDQVWHDLMKQGPDGLPKAGDNGLEGTRDQGRTYWGGALFCLLADIEIRSRTKNARSFDDALRAVIATGATVDVGWDVARFLDVGDAATGQNTLHDLFTRYGLAPGTFDLPLLWKRLGVDLRGDAVVYDDTAPLAAVRRAITSQ